MSTDPRPALKALGFNVDAPPAPDPPGVDNGDRIIATIGSLTLPPASVVLGIDFSTFPPHVVYRTPDGVTHRVPVIRDDCDRR